MALTDTLLTIAILLMIFLLAYLKMTNKTIKDFAMEIKEIVSDQKMEEIDL